MIFTHFINNLAPVQQHYVHYYACSYVEKKQHTCEGKLLDVDDELEAVMNSTK